MTSSLKSNGHFVKGGKAKGEESRIPEREIMRHSDSYDRHDHEDVAHKPKREWFLGYCID